MVDNDLSAMYAPVVSVIIPVFNSELYFNRCLDSVLSQSLDNIEIIIINDGSTDSSVKIAENRAKFDKRIKLVHLLGPLGAGAARNKGIELAKGEWIAFLDSDDFYPDKYVLELLVNTSLKHNADVCGGSLYTVDYQDRTISKCIKDQVFNKDGWVDYKDYQFEGGFYRFLYRKNVIKNKIDFPRFKRYQDPVFLVKILSSVKRFYCINKFTYAYRKYKKIEITENILMGIFSGIKVVVNISKNKHYTRLNRRMRYIYWKVFFNNIKFLLNSKRCFLHGLKVGWSIYFSRAVADLKYKQNDISVK